MDNQIEIKKIILKEEWIQVGPIFLDLGKLYSWKGNEFVITINYIGGTGHRFVNEENEAGEVYPENEYLSGEHHMALLNFLRNQYKPKVKL